ncbi:MAG: S41 family peptidase [Peptoniphilaceae bacterium]|nr:S41 family peptidase [Peptoniphilaceae bacterium]MDY6085379.1 S41 family peptidase [Peptoniphilaceae bacterium]
MGRLILFAFVLICGAGAMFFATRRLFSAQFDALPTLRHEVNETLLTDVRMSDTANRPLTRAEREADIAALRDVIRAHRGPDVAQEVDALAQAAIDASQDDAFFTQTNALVQTAFENRAHLLTAPEVALAVRNLGAGFYDAASPYAHALQDPRVQERAQRMRSAMSAQAWSDAVSKAAPDTTTAAGAAAIVGKTPSVADPLAYPTPTLTVHREGDVAVLSGLAFADGALQEQRETLKQVALDAAAHDVVVLDLRHASGASIAYWAEGIVPYLVPKTYGMKKALTVPAGANEYMAYLTDGETMASSDFSYASEAETPTLEWTITTEGAVEALAPSRIALLVDTQTGGAAETFADFLSQLDTVTRYGEPTAGTSWRVPDYLYALPHSGFVLSVASASDDDAKRAPLMPDIALPGDDLLQALLEVLANPLP